MTVYQEEKKFIKDVRKRVIPGENVPTEDLLQVLNKFEEMTEMTSVTVKIIDRPMINCDKLKQQTGNTAIKERKIF